MIDSVVTQWRNGRKVEGKDNSLKQCRGRQDRLMEKLLDKLDRTLKKMVERKYQIRCPIRYIITVLTYISIIINIPQATSFTIPSVLPSVSPSVFNPNTHTHTTSFHKQLVYDTRTARRGGGTKTTTRLHGIRGFRKWFSEQVRLNEKRWMR